jgi:hypothetical protein
METIQKKNQTSDIPKNYNYIKNNETIDILEGIKLL